MFRTWAVRLAAIEFTLSVRSFQVPETARASAWARRLTSVAAAPALGAPLAGHARDLAGERVQLVDHDVDRVLELEDLALDVDRDLAREVALRDRGRDLGDVADLTGELTRQQVHVVGQVLPGP